MPTIAPSWKEASFSLLCGGSHVCTPSWNKAADALDECFKLYVVAGGAACLRLGSGEEIGLEAGHAYFIPGHRLREQRCSAEMTVYWLHFLPEALYLAHWMSHIERVIRWDLGSVTFWQDTWLDLPRLFRESPPWLYYRVQAMLLQLVSDVLEPLDDGRFAVADPVFERLQPAIAFMEESLPETPTLAEIAATVDLAPNYFHRKFTAAFHVTPLAYLLGKRLNTARQLLLSTDWTLEKIALRTGFHSPFYLSRMFKRRFQISPAAFRKRRSP